MLAGLLLAASPAGAGPAAIRGVVRDHQGRGLGGVIVSAVRLDSGRLFQGVTRADGSFILANLPPGGPWAVNATTPGYATAALDGLALEPGRALALAVTLGRQRAEPSRVQRLPAPRP
jgi:hypothetical protein